LESGWWPTFVHSQLSSTRQLQRFANQVSLNRWVEVSGVLQDYQGRAIHLLLPVTGHTLHFTGFDWQHCLRQAAACHLRDHVRPAACANLHSPLATHLEVMQPSSPLVALPPLLPGLQRNYRGVADIYEDRLRLFAIGGGGRLLASRVAPMKRTPELGRLKGLRYAGAGQWAGIKSQDVRVCDAQAVGDTAVPWLLEACSRFLLWRLAAALLPLQPACCWRLWTCCRLCCARCGGVQRPLPAGWWCALLAKLLPSCDEAFSWAEVDEEMVRGDSSEGRAKLAGRKQRTAVAAAAAAAVRARAEVPAPAGSSSAAGVATRQLTVLATCSRAGRGSTCDLLVIACGPRIRPDLRLLLV
jgi:hypothetical protein